MAVTRQTVVGVFSERAQAESAIAELRQAGFGEGDIGYAIRNGGVGDAEAADLAADETAGGAATGALTGGLLGGLIGAAAALLVPGVGPVLAGGLLASALGGAAIGAAAGGLLGALVSMGVPEEEARFYESEFAAGRAVVTVRAGGRHDEAQAILQRHGAYDMGLRAQPAAPTTLAAAPAAAAPAAAMTGAVQAETVGPHAVLAPAADDSNSTPPRRIAPPLGDQARIAQRTEAVAPAPPSPERPGEAADAGAPPRA
jgi:hypothetical protein